MDGKSQLVKWTVILFFIRLYIKFTKKMKMLLSRLPSVDLFNGIDDQFPASPHILPCQKLAPTFTTI